MDHQFYLSGERWAWGFSPIRTLDERAVNISPGPLQEVWQFRTTNSPLSNIGCEYARAVDPDAAWFTAASVLTKE